MPDVVPLVVDMDGTLFLGDLLRESALKLVRQQPLAALQIPLWLLRGKAAVKNEIAQRVEIDAASMPYIEDLLAWLREQKAVGRRLVLCTASNQRYASEVAAHLGLFDEVIASDAQTNVSAGGKAEILVQRFGDQGFDYAGNSGDDLPVWARARQVIVVNARAPSGGRRSPALQSHSRVCAGAGYGVRLVACFAPAPVAQELACTTLLGQVASEQPMDRYGIHVAAGGLVRVASVETFAAIAQRQE